MYTLFTLLFQCHPNSTYDAVRSLFNPLEETRD